MNKQLTADYSYVSAVAECPRKAYYAFERGITSGETSLALHLGSTLHIALDHLYAHDWDIDGALAAAAEYWGDFKVPQTHKHAYATFGHVECIIKNYVDDRRDYDDIVPIKLLPEAINQELLPEGFGLSVDTDGHIKLVETPLGIKWGGLAYAGKIDLPNLTGGSYALWDHKTTRSWLSDHWAQKYALTHQMRGYIAILRALTGLPFDRVYINGVYTGKEAADPVEHWVGGVSPIDGKRKQARSTSRSRLFGPYIYSEQMLEETRQWAETWLAVAASMRERAESVGEAAWPQNDKSCFKYGDACPYFAICERSPHIREGIIRANYTHRTLTGVLASGADSDD